MVGVVPHADSDIVIAIAERLYQADMDVHVAFSQVRDERTAELFSLVIDRLEGLIGLAQDAVAGGGSHRCPGLRSRPRRICRPVEFHADEPVPA
jgi:hypothetical protein